jgi:hypothetical protein
MLSVFPEGVRRALFFKEPAMHICHPAMQTYLADFEARHGLSIRYQRWSSRYQDKAPFRHEVEILGPFSGLPALFQVPYKDEVRTIEVAHNTSQTGERIELSHGDNLYPVATVDGRRIQLAFDLERLFEAPVGDLQPGILLESVLGAALPLAVKNVKNYRWEDEAARFIQWNVQGVDDQVNAWKSNIRDNEQELERLTTMCASMVRKNAELREQSKAAQVMTKKEREDTARNEFQALTKMVPDPVQTVDLDYGRLVVVLSPITLEYEGCDYSMGSFTLQIAADNVRIWSDSGNRYPHPHVSSDGVPCWGNLGPHIAKLLGERQYVGLVAAIVEFLKAYNDRDAYRRIEHWDPDYSEED